MGKKSDRISVKAYLLEMQIMWKRNGKRRRGFDADKIRKKYKIGTIPIPEFTDILENEITDEAVNDFIERRAKYYKERKIEIEKKLHPLGEVKEQPINRATIEEFLPGFENEPKPVQTAIDFDKERIADNLGELIIFMRRIADALDVIACKSSRKQITIPPRKNAYKEPFAC